MTLARQPLHTTWLGRRLPLGLQAPAGPGAGPALPARIAALVRANEAESERLIGWVQLLLVATFALLYLASPRPSDAGSGLSPVPIALAIYASFTAFRLRCAYRDRLPGCCSASRSPPT